MPKRAAPEEPPDDAPLFNALPSETVKAFDKMLDSIEWDPPKTPANFRDAVAGYLLARPNEWVGGLELAKIGGAYAWRTRVSDARRQLGLTIENRQRKVGEITVSEYRVVV